MTVDEQTREDEGGLMKGESAPTSIQTVWGRLDLLRPGDNLPRLRDVAIVLNRISRWTGHGIYRPMSVLRHLLHVEKIMRVELGVEAGYVLLAGLLHDVHEAWTGDVSRPLKLAMRHLAEGRPSPFDQLEARGKAAVAHKYTKHGDPGVFHAEHVIEADLRSLGWEANHLFGPGHAEAWGVIPAEVAPTHYHFDEDALEAFLSRAAKLDARNVG